MKENSSTIFLSEDLPATGLHGGLKGKLQRLYSALIAHAMLRTLARTRPGAAVLPAAFLEGLTSSSTKLVSSSYVVSKSFAHANLDPLLQFHRQLLVSYRRLDPVISPAVAEALSCRVVLAGLLEHVARPAEALARFFAEEKSAKGILLLGGRSEQERIAESVARFLGWDVATTAWKWILAPISFLKERFRGDGLPSLAALGAQFSSGGECDTLGGVVFFCIDERRIRRLSDTMKELAALGRKVSLTALTNKEEVKAALAGSAAEFHSLNHFLPKSDLPERMMPLFERALGYLRTVFSEKNVWTGHHYRGVSLAGYTLRKLSRPWAKLSYESALFEYAACRYLDQRRPDLVVFSDIGLHSMILQRICRERRIRTMFYVYNPVLFTVAYWPKLLFESMRADIVLTGSQHMADTYVSQGGYSRDRVHVVGDAFSQPTSQSEREEERLKLRDELRLPAGEKIVLALSFFVSQDLSESQKRRYLRRVCEGAEKNGARLVVKAHPNESKPLLERMLAEEGVRAVKVAQHESLRALLLASDAVCMNFSQAGMEAVMTDTPLVVVQSKEQLQGFEDWVPYVREGAAIFADENEPMAAKIAPLLSDEKARAERLAAAARFRNKFIMPDGIVPKDRIVAEILKAL